MFLWRVQEEGLVCVYVLERERMMVLDKEKEWKKENLQVAPTHEQYTQSRRQRESSIMMDNFIIIFPFHPSPKTQQPQRTNLLLIVSNSLVDVDHIHFDSV